MLNEAVTYTSGGVGGKDMSHFTEQLDFDESDLNKRVDILHEILNTEELSDGTRCMDGYFEEYFDTKNRGFYNVHCNTSQSTSSGNLTCKQLEFMANYLLYSKENLGINDMLEYPIETSNNYTNARSTSYEKLKDIGGDILEQTLKEEKPKQYNNQTLNKITKEDRQELMNIQSLQDDIMLLRERISPDNEKYSSKDKQQMKKMMGDMKRTQYDIKNAFRKPISFNNVDSGRPCYTFWDNTGYYDENGEYVQISLNKIELSNYRHIYELLRYYGSIKEMVDDDIDSDWRYLLWELEYLIDKTPLNDSERDVIVWKVDELDSKTIIDNMKEKYDLDMSVQTLSSMFTTRIPKAIVETYIEDRLDWVYTYKIKGLWKKCAKCNIVKLATNRYFANEPRGLLGLKGSCKKCR